MAGALPWIAGPGARTIDLDEPRDVEEPEPTYDEMGQAIERFGIIVANDAIEMAEQRARIAELEAALDLVITAEDLISAKAYARDGRFGIEIG